MLRHLSFTSPWTHQASIVYDDVPADMQHKAGYAGMDAEWIDSQHKLLANLAWCASSCLSFIAVQLICVPKRRTFPFTGISSHWCGVAPDPHFGLREGHLVPSTYKHAIPCFCGGSGTCCTHCAGFGSAKTTMHTKLIWSSRGACLPTSLCASQLA